MAVLHVVLFQFIRCGKMCSYDARVFLKCFSCFLIVFPLVCLQISLPVGRWQGPRARLHLPGARERPQELLLPLGCSVCSGPVRLAVSKFSAQESCFCFDLICPHVSRNSSHSHTAKQMWSASACFSWPSAKGSVWLLGRSSTRSVGKATSRQLFTKQLLCRVPDNTCDRNCLFFVTQGLEYCEERFSQDLSGSAFPLRAQATNTRLLSCQTIEKFRPHPDRDDSMNEGEARDHSATSKGQRAANGN